MFINSRNIYNAGTSPYIIPQTINPGMPQPFVFLQQQNLHQYYNPHESQTFNIIRQQYLTQMQQDWLLQQYNQQWLLIQNHPSTSRNFHENYRKD